MYFKGCFCFGHLACWTMDGGTALLPGPMHAMYNLNAQRSHRLLVVHMLSTHATQGFNCRVLVLEEAADIGGLALTLAKRQPLEEAHTSTQSQPCMLDSSLPHPACAPASARLYTCRAVGSTPV